MKSGETLICSIHGFLRNLYRMRQAMPKKKEPTKDKPAPSAPGPKPDMLKIDYEWQQAIKKSLEKKKPPDGWPK
jgi:hypothetical protein